MPANPSGATIIIKTSATKRATSIKVREKNTNAATKKSSIAIKLASMDVPTVPSAFPLSMEDALADEETAP